MLKIDNVSYKYPKGKYDAITGLTMTIDHPGVYGLLGANGEGKSTLLYLIEGLLRPATGSVTYNDIPTVKRLPETLGNIFLLPEEFALPAVPLKTYLDLTAPLYPNFDVEAMRDYLHTFNLNDDIHLGRLSMGQRKKALISFALACNTPLLLMDEPTNGLDIPGKGEFRRVLTQNISPDRTIVISTHQVRDLDRVLSHILMLANHNVLLDVDVCDIAERLRFEFTTDPAVVAGALYSEAAPGGFQTILRRTGDERVRPASYVDADINLETLFNLAYNNPALTTSL